jgi:hypothetical protein
MIDNAELQRQIRLRRLGRRIVASLPTDLDLEESLPNARYVGELSAGAPRRTGKPPSGKAVLRAQLEVALANYHGPVTVCPPAGPPEPDRSNELDFVDDDEVDGDAVTVR